MNYTQWYSQHGKFEKSEQWMVNNLMLETIGGSQAYGCQTPTSDYDLLGIILPKAEHLFPQKFGFILGFDQVPAFSRKELKGKDGKVNIDGKMFEAEWVSLIEFFIHAGLKGSPNLVEILFVKRPLVTVGTKMGWMLRDNRQKFLSMKTFHAFKGYANGQMHRIRQRNPETEERKNLVAKHGYDVKMAYHTLRLIDQLEQILLTNDIDLERNKEECKLMRKGEWGDFDRFDNEFQKRMSNLEEIKNKSNLSQFPRQGDLKILLQEILEEHFGSFEKMGSEISQTDYEFISSKDVFEKLDKIEKLLKPEPYVGMPG